MTRIRILHLLNTLADCSLTRLVLALVRGLDQTRYELHVGCLSNGASLTDEVRRAGASVANFEMQGYHDLGAISRVRRYIRCHDIQVVHTHILRADLVGAGASRLTGGRQLLATKHNLGYAAGLDRRAVRNILYYVSLYMPNIVITVSKWLQQRLARLPGLGDGRVVAICNGIDTDQYFLPGEREACRHELGVVDDMNVIGYLGRLVAGKGLETLIQVMPAILQARPQTRLLLVGEGPLRNVLMDLTHETGVASAVTFTGLRTDVPRLLAALDFFVLPSLAEGLPLSILEAMAASKPVVATGVGGVNELIEDEVTGLLIPPNNPEALIAALLRLLEDGDLAERLGRQGRSHAVNSFSLQQMVQEYDALYRSLPS